MKFLDFFAGIGGFRRGMEAAGHECVGFCEYDSWAVASYTSMHLITKKQREYLSTLTLKQRQKEILRDEYRNGEWYANDIRRVYAGDIPKADCWCFGFPCQDISVAGKQLGFQGNRSSLFFRVMYLIGQLEEENKPTYLFIENVKNLLSVNGGWDFARLLVEMEQGGYDAEWQVFNSRDYGVPQNRERCFIIGHLRGRSESEVFSDQRANGESSVSIIGHRARYRRSMRTFTQEGITEALDTDQGGGRGLHVAIKVIGKVNSSQDGKVHGIDGIAKCHSAGHNNNPKIAIPVLTPERAEKRQNGRRFKEDGEPMFTLTSNDRHGVAVGIEDVPEKNDRGIYVRISEELTVYAVWYEKYGCYIAIRRLTPRECFRLQGWTDDYFEKAQFVNSDSQLYKQAGNGVTVTVIEAIAEKLKLIEQEESNGKTDNTGNN